MFFYVLFMHVLYFTLNVFFGCCKHVTWNECCVGLGKTTLYEHIQHINIEQDRDLCEQGRDLCKEDRDLWTKSEISVYKIRISLNNIRVSVNKIRISLKKIWICEQDPDLCEQDDALYEQDGDYKNKNSGLMVWWDFWV